MFSKKRGGFFSRRSQDLLDEQYRGTAIQSQAGVANFVLTHSSDILTVNEDPDNTISGIVWTRTGQGRFRGFKSGAFPEGKTLCLCSGGQSPATVKIFRKTDDEVLLETYDSSFTRQDNILAGGTAWIKVIP